MEDQLTRLYRGWLISLAVAKICRCRSVRLGRCGLFYVDHIRLCLCGGIVIEIDDLRLTISFFNTHYTKPFIITISDIRIEGECNEQLPLTSTYKRRCSQKDFERYLHWLQYTSAIIRTARVVFLGIAPGSLLHSTFQQLQLDGYRDREGMQVELSCQLLQAKLFSRGTTQNTAPLLVLSLGLSLCCNVPLGTLKLKRLAARITDPQLTLSDGVLDYFHDHPIRQKTRKTSNQFFTSFSVQSLLNISLKLDIENLVLRYTANMDFSKMRTVSARLNASAVSMEGNKRFAIVLSGINMDDQMRETFCSCSEFDVELNRERDNESFFVDMKVFNPRFVMSQKAIVEWTEYYHTIERRISTGGRFDDDFSTASINLHEVPVELKQLCCKSFSIEVNSFHSRLMLSNGQEINAGLELGTLRVDDNFSSAEVGLESVWIRQGTLFANSLDSRFCHAWGTTLTIGALLTQYSQCNDMRRLLVKLIECQVEYEEELTQQMASFLSSLLCRDPPSSAHSLSSAFQPDPLPQIVSVVQISMENIALFILARHSLYLILSTEQLRVDALPSSSTFSVLALNFKILQGSVTGDKFVFWEDSAQIKSKYFCGSSDRLMMRVSRLPRFWEWVLLAESTVTLVWSTAVHIIFLETFRSLKQISLLFGQKAPSKTSHMFHFTIETSSSVIIEFQLPRDYVMCWEASSLHVRYMDHLIIEMPHFTSSLDGHPILTIEKFCIGKQTFDAGMDLGRNEFKDLKNRTNKLWIWSADAVMFVFPYDYNFASGYDEIINAWKWVKLVHGYKRKQFTLESPLPSDLRFSIKNASVQINDDPFEVQLQNNYELMVDEVYECERRRQMLDQKLEQLQKTRPFLSQSKADELHRSLIKKNAEIYVERSKKLPSSRRHLCLWSITNLEIRAYADMTLHGKENVVRNLKNFNSESPYPTEGMEFSTLWARAVEVDCDDWIMQFRDYPLPYVLMKDAHFWGHLIGSEHLAGPRSIRTSTVTLPEPWGLYTIERNMCPLKYYYDLSCEIKVLNCTYGPCWEPCLSMIGLCWANVSPPSRDPSPPLPFWDKIRLLLHGRFSMLCQSLVTSLLASTDPYNSTELVEICWKEFGFDWITDQFCVQTDMDAFVRTASKYDESRVLHLPGFKFSVKMDWSCIGDPHDHHSAQPCAPDKLPEYSSTNLEHDSYRAFRSTHLDLVFNLEVKQPDSTLTNSQHPQILLYANIFRWLEFLKNTMTTVNRPVKRGRLFSGDKTKKKQLSRHLKRIQLSVTLPRFLITYWMSYSSSHGLRMISESLHLTSSMELHILQNCEQKDGINRRRIAKWSVLYVSAQLLNAQIHLFGANSQNFASPIDDNSFFIGLDRLSYTREARSQNCDNSSSGRKVKLSENNEAVHRLTIHDLRASWTPENRDTCLAIADGVHKAHILRRILGTDALKTPSFTKSGVPPSSSVILNDESVTKSTMLKLQSDSEKARNRLRHGSDGRVTEENDMLQRLIDEASTKLVAYDEETTDIPSDMLQGIALCTADDVVLVNWQIDLINSQAVLRGKEKDGFVLLTAARASVTQRIYVLVWKKSQLLSKKSWCATLSGMQYFAPLVMSRNPNSSSSPAESIPQGFHWLNRDIIEEKTCSDPSISDRLNPYISTGEAVGGVVVDHGNVAQIEGKLQLQRVVSRCSCQMYFCYFSDTLDLDTRDIPYSISETNEPSEIWGQPEPVDCFTLKHNMLEARFQLFLRLKFFHCDCMSNPLRSDIFIQVQVSTNPEQYQMVMNIVNQLVLFVDPRKKESDRRRQRLRFELQLKDVEEVKSSIFAMQAELRDVIAVIRSLERRLFFLNRQLQESGNDAAVLEANKTVTAEIDEMKKNQIVLCDELAMTISCYKEKQVERMRQLVNAAEEEQAPVARRFEVCFEDCIWRLTESDGQIALAEMQIRNFLYTRTARIDNSGEHLLEIGTVQVTNLLPDTLYKHTLQAQNTSRRKSERQPSSIRVVCREKAPVGGISVKEHFEINVSPMNAQITYRFFEKMMEYFFPGRNIDKEDQRNLDTNEELQNSQGVSVGQWLRGAMNGSFRRTNESNQLRDDIDRMKERAQENNVFLYIKIPEVPFIVSYKAGNKEKNIEDVDRFQLVFPLCEYHEKNWTWLDLALAIKQRCRRFMKQKLLRNRLTGVEHPSIEIDEDEKKRIVLGTRVTGTPLSHFYVTSLFRNFQTVVPVKNKKKKNN
uniref:FMP27/BLTP2/Hobbit GFWDK motif-containing RBG unit domain-containing protein n=1 Tax=Setaria digitata TaxID=48799 RepID=A0A915PXZ3_9BILA